MRLAIFYSTLFLLILAGICSGILVATDWQSLSSENSFGRLGVLLFLVGSGIGAVIMLITLWVCKLCRREPQNKSIENSKSVGEVIEEKDEKIEKGSYDIEVYRVQTEGDSEKPSADRNVISKIGLGVKNTLYKLALLRWNSDVTAGVFSPAQKAWEKPAQNNEGIPAPTPRIYVLPPESVDGEDSKGAAKTKHSRSRSEISIKGRMGMPDVTILEIKMSQEIDGDIKDGRKEKEQPAQNDHTEASCAEDPPLADPLPEIRKIDSRLAEYVQSIDPKSDKVVYMLSIMIEEVLPRPDSGLLKRMLRMSEIPVGRVEGSSEPVLHLRVGSECHLSVGLLRLGGDSLPNEISGPHSLILKPLDGEEIVLSANFEKVDEMEHVSSVIWDLKSHSSQALTKAASDDSSPTVLTPIEMTLVFHLHSPNLIRDVEVKKTFMASMRQELVSLDTDDRFTHEDVVVDFVLSKMDLISMPSLLMFLEMDAGKEISD